VAVVTDKEKSPGLKKKIKIRGSRHRQMGNALVLFIYIKVHIFRGSRHRQKKKALVPKKHRQGPRLSQ